MGQSYRVRLPAADLAEYGHKQVKEVYLPVPPRIDLLAWQVECCTSRRLAGGFGQKGKQPTPACDRSRTGNLKNKLVLRKQVTRERQGGVRPRFN